MDALTCNFLLLYLVELKLNLTTSYTVGPFNLQRRIVNLIIRPIPCVSGTVHLIGFALSVCIVQRPIKCSIDTFNINKQATSTGGWDTSTPVTLLITATSAFTMAAVAAAPVWRSAYGAELHPTLSKQVNGSLCSSFRILQVTLPVPGGKLQPAFPQAEHTAPFQSGIIKPVKV